MPMPWIASAWATMVHVWGRLPHAPMGHSARRCRHPLHGKSVRRHIRSQLWLPSSWTLRKCRSSEINSLYHAIPTIRRSRAQSDSSRAHSRNSLIWQFTAKRKQPATGGSEDSPGCDRSRPTAVWSDYTSCRTGPFRHLNPESARVLDKACEGTGRSRSTWVELTWSV